MQPAEMITQTPKEGWQSSRLPKVSIVILNWNSYEVTRDCLLSLQKLDYSNLEIVLVDNGSVDSSWERLATEFPEVRLLRNEDNLGFTGGNNAAIRDVLLRGTDYLLLLNNDTIVAETFLRELIQVAEKAPEIGLLNPKILYYEPSDRIWYAGGEYRLGWSFAKHVGAGQRENGKYSETREVSFTTGCALLIRAEAFAKVGLLDDSFFFGFEDLDWCVRARKAGYKAFYVPSALVWHRDGYVTKKNFGISAKDFYHFRNSVLLARKHLRAWHWPMFMVSMARHLIYRTAGYLIRIEPHRVRALYAGLWSGCKIPVASTTKVSQFSTDHTKIR